MPLKRLHFLIQPEERYLLKALEMEGELRALLYRFARNLADVDELLQETYVHLLAAGSHPGEEVRSMRAFTLVVARNVARDWFRRQRVVPFDLVADLQAFDTEDELDRLEERIDAQQQLEMIARTVRRLPPRCRRVFVMRKGYGHSQKEIAARLGISEHTVEAHLFQATRRCADAMSAMPKKRRLAWLLDRLRRRT